MRRTTLILCAALAGASLAFAPVVSSDELVLDVGEDGPSLELTAAPSATGVDGTLAFGGAATTSTDPAGDAQVPSVGLDIGDVTIAQEGTTLVVTLDVLDAVQGEVAPTALYKVDMPNSKSLMAFRGPGAWDYQLADFSDGYTSAAAEGTFDGSTITWRVPTTAFGSIGSQLVANQLSSQGVSPAGLASLQLSGFVVTDPGKAIAGFVTGGRIDVTVTDATGAQVDTAIAFATPAGGWSYDGSDLAPGTYTVTATSAYADLTDQTVTELVIG